MNKKYFIPFSLLFLLIGLFGIIRATYRPDAQFRCDARDEWVIITDILPNGAAYQSGLMKGDQILRVDEIMITSCYEIEFLLDGKQIGKKVLFAVQRNGEIQRLSVTLAPKYGKWFIIFNLLLGILFWAIGVFVYLKKPTDRAAFVFSMGSMIIAVAIMMIWPGYPTKTSPVEYLHPILYLIFYPLTPALFLYFMTIYPHEKRIIRQHKLFPILLFIPSLIFIVLLETTYFSAAHFNSLVNFHYYHQLYTAFRIYFVVYLILSIVFLLHSLKIADTKESRQKVQWIIGGIIIGVAPFILLWTIPQIFGLSTLIAEEIIYLFLMLIPLSIAFSILKYHALDIEIIINRGIVYTLLTGVIVALYLLLVGLLSHGLHLMNPASSHVLVIIFTLVAAMLFSPIKQRIQTFVDRNFYRVKYNYRLALKDFSTAIAASNDPMELKKLIQEKINSVIPINVFALLGLNSSKTVFEVIESLGISEQDQLEFHYNLQSKLVQTLNGQPTPLAKKGCTELSDIPELPRDEIHERLGIRLIIPITLQDRLVGLLAMGKKLAETRYSEEDLALLSKMATDGLLALERLRFQESMILERAEREKLEELNQLKSEFISHVSHELRTPLTSIQWSMENLLDGIPEKSSPKVTEYLEGIYDSSQHLGRMIENLLDITRIEAGRIELYPERLNLASVVEKVLDISKPLADKKNIQLDVDLANDLWVQADQDRLREILTNLVDNAIKYSHEKSRVQISAKIMNEAELKNADLSGSKMIAISVIDQGVGIPKEKQTAIFERFERIKAEKGAREKGLGLGLHIVKKLVELQGGTIWVESKPGKGSVFSFTLPGY